MRTNYKGLLMKPGTIVNIKGSYLYYKVTHETMGGKKVYIKAVSKDYNLFYADYELVEIAKCRPIN